MRRTRKNAIAIGLIVINLSAIASRTAIHAPRRKMIAMKDAAATLIVKMSVGKPAWNATAGMLIALLFVGQPTTRAGKPATAMRIAMMIAMRPSGTAIWIVYRNLKTKKFSDLPDMASVKPEAASGMPG